MFKDRYRSLHLLFLQLSRRPPKLIVRFSLLHTQLGREIQSTFNVSRKTYWTTIIIGIKGAVIQVLCKTSMNTLLTLSSCLPWSTYLSLPHTNPWFWSTSKNSNFTLFDPPKGVELYFSLGVPVFRVPQRPDPGPPPETGGKRKTRGKNHP